MRWTGSSHEIVKNIPALLRHTDERTWPDLHQTPNCDLPLAVMESCLWFSCLTPIQATGKGTRNIWSVATSSCLKDLEPHRWLFKHVTQSWQIMPFLVTLQRTQLKTHPFLRRKQGQLEACRYPPKANILQKLNIIQYLFQGVAECCFQPTSSLPPPGKTQAPYHCPKQLFSFLQSIYLDQKTKTHKELEC